MSSPRLRMLRRLLLTSLGILPAIAAAWYAPASGPSVTPTPFSLTATPLPTPDTTSVAGTTDGITLMGVIIVLIIILPIIFRRQTWIK
jgi:hypothetical protein